MKRLSKISKTMMIVLMTILAGSVVFGTTISNQISIFTDDIDMHGNRITNLSDPLNDQEAATKNYVDTNEQYEENTDASTKCSGTDTYLSGDDTCETEQYEENTNTDNYTTSISFSGTDTKTLTLSRNDLSDLTADFTDRYEADTDTVWTISEDYIINNSGNLSLNKTKLNNTVKDLDDNTQLTEEEVQDYVYNNVLSGTQTLIDVTYDDANNEVNYVVDNDLSNYDNTNSDFATNTRVDRVNTSSNINSLFGNNNLSVDTNTDNYTDSVSVSGTNTKTITIGRNDLSDLTADFNDIDTTRLWTISNNYLINDSNILTLDEIKLNNTIDNRDDYEPDTNETRRMNNLVDNDCSGSDKMIGADNDGNVVCAVDNNTEKIASGFYLYNDTDKIYLNETILNNTIDDRDDYEANTDNYTTGISFSGTDTKTLTLTRNNLSDLTADFNDRYEADTDTVWAISEQYLVNNSDTLELNETLLNNTIDNRDDYEPDTNETTRMNNIADFSCSGDDKVSSFGSDSTPVCTTDNTIGNCSGDQSCDNVVYTTDEFIGGLSCSDSEIAKYNSTSGNWECEIDKFEANTNTNIIDDNLYNTSELEEQSDGNIGIIDSFIEGFDTVNPFQDLSSSRSGDTVTIDIDNGSSTSFTDKFEADTTIGNCSGDQSCGLILYDSDKPFSDSELENDITANYSRLVELPVNIDEDKTNDVVISDLPLVDDNLSDNIGANYSKLVDLPTNIDEDKTDDVLKTTDFGGEVSGTYDSITLNDGALDDQYLTDEEESSLDVNSSNYWDNKDTESELTPSNFLSLGDWISYTGDTANVDNSGILGSANDLDSAGDIFQNAITDREINNVNASQVDNFDISAPNSYYYANKINMSDESVTYVDGRNYFDTSNSNEFQNLSTSRSGNTITMDITNGTGASFNDINADSECSGTGTYYSGDGTCESETDSQTLSVDSTNTDDDITISNGNTVTISDDYEANTDASTKCNGTDTYLSGDNTCETDDTGSGSSLTTNDTQELTSEGTVGVWNFNSENLIGSGGSEVVLDSSTHNNHGDNNGATHNAFGGFNNGGAFDFDGNDDYVSIADDDSLDLQNNFSVSSWVNANDISGAPQGILTKGSYSLKEYDDDYIFEVLGNGTTWSKSGDVGNAPQGLAVYDGKLYVANYNSDDVYVFDGTSWSKSGDVGNGPRGLAVYDGKLYVANLGSDDVYVFDGTSWTKSGDVGTNPHGFAVYGGKLYVSNAGSDDVYVFDGTTWSKSGDVGTGPYGLAVYDGKLYVANYDSNDVYVFDGTSWSKSGDVGTGPVGLAVYGGKLYVANRDSNDVYVFDGTSWTKSGDVGTDPFGLAVYDGKLYVSNYDSDDVYSFGTGESLWASKGSGFEHISGVITDNEVKLYVNGEEKASTSHNLTFANNNNPLLIGKSYGSSQSGYFGGNDENFDGQIDEVKIYDRALSSEEVSKQYQQEKESVNSYVSQKDVTVDGSTGNVGIGFTSPSEKLEVDGNVLADGHLTHSNVPDMNNREKALDKLNNIGKWKGRNGEVNYKEHYAYYNLTKEKTFEDCENVTKEVNGTTQEVEECTTTEKNVSVGSALDMEERIASMEKMIYELRQKNKQLKNRTEELCGSGLNLSWC